MRKLYLVFLVSFILVGCVPAAYENPSITRTVEKIPFEGNFFEVEIKIKGPMMSKDND